jgi:hypothetical protein
MVQRLEAVEEGFRYFTTFNNLMNITSTAPRVAGKGLVD